MKGGRYYGWLSLALNLPAQSSKKLLAEASCRILTWSSARIYAYDPLLAGNETNSEKKVKRVSAGPRLRSLPERSNHAGEKTPASSH